MRIRTLFVVLACCMANLMQAQADSLALTEAFYKYLKTIDDKDAAATAEMLYPKIFDLMEKADMIDIMQMMYDDKEMEIRFENSKLKKIGAPIEHEGNKYVAMDYEYQMTFVYKARYLKKNLKNVAKGLIEERGAENVAVDKKNHTIVIQADKTLIAIADPSYEGWKFIEKKSERKTVLKRILPEEVVENL